MILPLRKSREAAIVHDLLGNYHGVLISDFYPGYDSVQCRQQKCWVHLIRDLNNDLWQSPLDTEFEQFVLEVKNLFVPIMEAVQRYGLKKWHLSKFKIEVEKFYRKCIKDRRYKFELALKYQKRFERYKESLFTFLEQVICGVKRCRIVKEPLRLTKERISDVVMEIACGLHNLRVTFRQPLQTIDITNFDEISYFQ